MLQITSIKNGFMLDHIKAGMGVKIFRYLHLDELGHQVALIINADSKKIGKKDIIKIENLETINYTVLGLLSPGITINEVRNEIIISKIKPELPEEIKNILIIYDFNLNFLIRTIRKNLQRNERKARHRIKYPSVFIGRSNLHPTVHANYLQHAVLFLKAHAFRCNIRNFRRRGDNR